MSNQAQPTVKLLALDVDGVLSDGKIYLSNSGEEIKSFNIQDGLGIKLLQRNGVAVAIITGRSSRIVDQRAEELGIEHVIQGRSDKLVALLQLIDGMELSLEEVAYMGDDLPDLAAIKACGLGLTVSDANPVVQQHADWVSSCRGGDGAVRQACELILERLGRLNTAISEYM
jgi:3-deoxy-D-manno-octulosonate 8-phosphate phosphatase (KDO 8-P phosphatase)